MTNIPPLPRRADPRGRPITLYPSSLAARPEPDLEKAIGMHETHELAVIGDTFHPLKLTEFAKELDHVKCWHSWYKNAGVTSDALLSSHM